MQTAAYDSATVEQHQRLGVADLALRQSLCLALDHGQALARYRPVCQAGPDSSAIKTELRGERRQWDRHQLPGQLSTAKSLTARELAISALGAPAERDEGRRDTVNR